MCVCMSVCVEIQPGSYCIESDLNFDYRSTVTFHCTRLTHIDLLPPALIQTLSPPQLSFPQPDCSAACTGGSYPVYFQALGPALRQAVSQAVWCRAEGLMRVSERRSPTFPRRLAAGRACGGGFASFSRPLRFLRSSGSYSFPARKQPSPATAELGGLRGRGGGSRGVWLQNESKARYSKPWA